MSSPFPNPADTIVAPATGSQCAILGIVRLSGPAAFELVADLLPPQSHPPVGGGGSCVAMSIRLDETLQLPATVYWFRGPRSYTGQDVVELHTVGNVPLLRELIAQLVRRGARPALPGEFTARAYMNGKLPAAAVETVLDLVQARGSADARRALRRAAVAHEAQRAALENELVELLARVEAGIDFVEEEDVRFIAPEEIAACLDRWLAALAASPAHSVAGRRHERLHVALAGLPNAGKSTLFNRLLGSDRALVSPTAGTTRDVLTGDLSLGRITVALQDCAGLGASADELELAAHVAARRATQQADLVLWVHDQSRPWAPAELSVIGEFPETCCVIALSKSDLTRSTTSAPAIPHATYRVCAISGAGIDDLKGGLLSRLERLEGADSAQVSDYVDREIDSGLRRAREIIGASDPGPPPLELLAIELRTALMRLAGRGTETVDDKVLTRIFRQFCIGK